MEAFAFRHAGFRFAVPHARVMRVHPTRPDVPPLVLVRDAAPEADAAVYVELDCGGSARAVPCAQAGIVELGPPQALPGVVRGVVRRHLVGWCLIDGELVWLVDLTRFDPD